MRRMPRGRKERRTAAARTSETLFRSIDHLRSLGPRSADAAADAAGGDQLAHVSQSAGTCGLDRLPEFRAISQFGNCTVDAISRNTGPNSPIREDGAASTIYQRPASRATV